MTRDEAARRIGQHDDLAVRGRGAFSTRTAVEKLHIPTPQPQQRP